MSSSKLQAKALKEYRSQELPIRMGDDRLVETEAYIAALKEVIRDELQKRALSKSWTPYYDNKEK